MSTYRVYALCYARRTGRRGQHFCGYDERWDEPHPTAYYVWLAVSAEHTVVVDTGIGPSRAEGFDDYVEPSALLAEFGVPAGSVDRVVLTHLHYDHTGTAAAFHSARYVVQQSEVDYWTGPVAARIEREKWLVDPGDVDAVLGSGRADVVSGDAEVLPGLSVHLVGGHTAGMQVVRVATERGRVVLASDASHFYENIEDDRPFPILHSMPGMYAAFDRINALADAPSLVVAGHDPEVLHRFPTETDRVARIA
ncbi:N-acyl homoserine lactonase family protein [Amycolatopsis sacchari]|uniref:N-acyl homoserine lactonase family protein n=1 Tax=Amycolatopsis sacchari TaxID=115433 RepID=UPI003D7500C3